MSYEKALDNKTNRELFIEKSLNILKTVYVNKNEYSKWHVGELKHIIDEYGNSFPKTNKPAWYSLTNSIVYNDAKLEGITTTKDEVSKIVTDLRLKGKKSKYWSKKFKANRSIIEIAGHSKMYDYIFNTDDNIDVYGIQNLHKHLFQFAPKPEFAGKFREFEVELKDTNIHPPHPRDIYKNLFFINQDVMDLLKNKDKLTFSQYIDNAVRIHHQLVVTQPFFDGNKRTSRAFTNWLFSKKGLPPVYIKHRYKEEYIKAIEIAYNTYDYTQLQIIFYKRIFSSLVKLNELEIGNMAINNTKINGPKKSNTKKYVNAKK